MKSGMRNFKKLTIAAFLLPVSIVSAHAENREFKLTPTWDIDFGMVFDNREGDGKISKDKTYLFSTLAPEIGLRFSPTDRIAGGVVWNQPLENGVKDGRVVPTLYYRHEGKKWHFSFGMFPRTQLHEKLPGFLCSDSLAYFQRNIRGALVQYQGKNGFIDFYMDWRAQQTETRREAFNLVLHGDWRPARKMFLAGGHVMMNHFAKTKHPDESQRIVDNFLVNPYVGIDASRHTPLDSLIFKAGALMTIERNREFSQWDTPAGFWMEMVAEWKCLGIKNSLYTGGKLFPLYDRFGALLYQGEAYYKTKFYNRTDVYVDILHNKYMNLRGELNFNVASGSFMFYQRLMLDINIGNMGLEAQKSVKKSKKRR